MFGVRFGKDESAREKMVLSQMRHRLHTHLRMIMWHLLPPNLPMGFPNRDLPPPLRLPQLPRLLVSVKKKKLGKDDNENQQKGDVFEIRNRCPAPVFFFLKVVFRL